MALRELEQRFGIPSLRGGALRWFYLLFGAGTIYLTVANTLSELSRSGAGDWLHIQSIVTEQIVRAAGASLIVSYIITDGGDMVISAILRERNRKRDLEEGAKKDSRKCTPKFSPSGKPGTNVDKKPKIAAKVFDEPPPGLASTNGGSNSQ